jgi:hypothetical protein
MSDPTGERVAVRGRDTARAVSKDSAGVQVAQHRVAVQHDGGVRQYHVPQIIGQNHALQVRQADVHDVAQKQPRTKMSARV